MVEGSDPPQWGWGEECGAWARGGMPRKPRMEVADGIHHVWARGNDRQLIYREDGDCLLYLDLLAAVVARTGWRLFAYCLMGNHLHLLLQTPDPNLGAGM